MEPEGLLPLLKEPTTCPCSELQTVKRRKANWTVTSRVGTALENTLLKEKWKKV